MPFDAERDAGHLRPGRAGVDRVVVRFEAREHDTARAPACDQSDGAVDVPERAGSHGRAMLLRARPGDAQRSIGPRGLVRGKRERTLVVGG